MKILSDLKTLLGKAEPRSPATHVLTKEEYAMFPIDLLTSGEHPLNTWRQLGAHVPKGMEGFWMGCVLHYQMYTFYAVNADKFTPGIADELLEIQRERMNHQSAGWGDDHANGIKHIIQVMHACRNDPKFFIDPEGKEVEVPSEYHLAMTFLVTNPDSPYRMARDVATAGHRPEFRNREDLLLMADLAQKGNTAGVFFDHSASLVRFLK